MMGIRNLLVVDDAPEVLDVVSDIFSEVFNLKTIKATTGLEALRALQNEPIDALITDINMPKMDGFGLLRILKTLGNGQIQIPAYGMTGEMNANYKGVKAVGAHGLVDKSSLSKNYGLLFSLMNNFNPSEHKDLNQPTIDSKFGFDMDTEKPEEGVYEHNGLYVFQRNVARDIIDKGMDGAVAKHTRSNIVYFPELHIVKPVQEELQSTGTYDH